MKRPRRILVATDFSECGDRAVHAAVVLCRHFEAELHLSHALEVPIPLFEPYAVSVPAEFVAAAREVAEKKLASAFETARAAGLSGDTHLGEVPAAPCIVEHADQIGADWIVLGTHGHTGLKHVLLGSVAERVVRESKVPVFTVKGSESFRLPRVLVVGVDFSEDSDGSLAAAVLLAREFGASLHLVHALDLRIPYVTPYEITIPEALIESAHADATRRLEKAAQGIEGVAAEIRVCSAPAHEALCEAAEEVGAGLIVTGSRGLSGLKHALLGSVAERTLRHAPCSVLTVKG